ncbi:MAG: HIT family protein [Defluviitaleaceae bacterium]|nr:HIT family protein [Defluviitaleaceae bacterium]
MECIFCKIVKGELPSYTVFEDNNFKAFFDVFPASIGHTLVVPKKHYKDIYDLQSPYTENIFNFVQKVAKNLKEKLECDGINILQNNEIAAGQTIFHYHIHLIPRYKDDGLKVNPAPMKSLPVDSEFEKLLKKLK